VATLRIEALAETPGHDGEILACDFTPDGRGLLSAGWDGFLRMWDVAQGNAIAEVRIATKPVSACAVAPDGKSWWAGTMEGMLIQWDPEKSNQQAMFLAHTRPISSLEFSPDGNTLATTSWDCSVSVWQATDRLNGRVLGHHGDIVSGCGFTPNGRTLVSWSHDGTAIVWDIETQAPLCQMLGHNERIIMGAISADGRWLVTGARDGEVKLWDIASGQEANSLPMKAPIMACFFLLDAEALVLADAHGRITLHNIPLLSIQSEGLIGTAVQTGALAPGGDQIALGTADGRIGLIHVEGFDSLPLAVTATPSVRVTANALQRFFGQSTETAVYRLTCPVCRAVFEIPNVKGNRSAVCPQCRRSIRICAITPLAEPVGGVIR
jgi:WD40 repeat protein